MNLTFFPGSTESLFRIRLGITTWYLGDTVTVSMIPPESIIVT
jgi:hypothetical protein